MNQHEALLTYCKSLRLPTLGDVLVETLARAQRESWSIETCLLHLLEQEVEGRRRRRIERLLRTSQLPLGKTLAHFDQNRVPLRIRRLLPQLELGDFVDRSENILFFGLPGHWENALCCWAWPRLGPSWAQRLIHPHFQTCGPFACGQTRL